MPIINEQKLRVSVWFIVCFGTWHVPLSLSADPHEAEEGRFKARDSLHHECPVHEWTRFGQRRRDVATTWAAEYVMIWSAVLTHRRRPPLHGWIHPKRRVMQKPLRVLLCISCSLTLNLCPRRVCDLEDLGCRLNAEFGLLRATSDPGATPGVYSGTGCPVLFLAF